LAHVHILPTAN